MKNTESSQQQWKKFGAVSLVRIFFFTVVWMAISGNEVFAHGLELWMWGTLISTILVLVAINGGPKSILRYVDRGNIRPMIQPYRYVLRGFSTLCHVIAIVIFLTQGWWIYITVLIMYECVQYLSIKTAEEAVVIHEQEAKNA